MNNYTEKRKFVSLWEGYLDLLSLLVSYYSEKFTKACLMSLDPYNWYSKRYFTFNGDVYQSEYISLKDLYEESDSPKMRQLQQYIDYVVSRIEICINQKGKKVSIAILYFFGFLTSENKREIHTNLLIFKPFKKTLEWFEPKTPEMHTELAISNKILFHILKNSLENVKTIGCKNIKIIYPDEICFISGPQTIQNSSKLPNLSLSGYCALWSLLIMKLSLKYPYKSAKTIIDELFKLYPNSEQYSTSDKLQQLMYAYSNEISDILLKQHNMSVNTYIYLKNQGIKKPIPKESSVSVTLSSQVTNSDSETT